MDKARKRRVGGFQDRSWKSDIQLQLLMLLPHPHSHSHGTSSAVQKQQFSSSPFSHFLFFSLKLPQSGDTAGKTARLGRGPGKGQCYGLRVKWHAGKRGGLTPCSTLPDRLHTSSLEKRCYSQAHQTGNCLLLFISALPGETGTFYAPFSANAIEQKNYSQHIIFFYILFLR